MTTSECFGCGESIPGGVRILGQYLCPNCEARIVRVKAGRLEYQNWIDNCKRFWEKTGINFRDFEE